MSLSDPVFMEIVRDTEMYIPCVLYVGGIRRQDQDLILYHHTLLYRDKEKKRMANVNFGKTFALKIRPR